jgi:predicted glutamine amidotransferase
MSARVPTTIRLSFEELARHGGGTGPHRDGWGIGYLQDGEAALFREPDAAHGSLWVRFIQEHPPRAPVVIAHVRRATQGPRALRNTQPFSRELGGRMHLFAHNGMLPGIETNVLFRSHRFRCVGDTDSEHAFCALLERLAPLLDDGVPSEADRLCGVREFAAEISRLGPANFLYSDGEIIFAHGHRRMHEDGTIRAPGMHLLCRSCTFDQDEPALAGVAFDPMKQQDVALVASVPLSHAAWAPVAEGEVIVLRDGRVSGRFAPMPLSEKR